MLNVLKFGFAVALFTVMSQTAKAECDMLNKAGCGPVVEQTKKDAVLSLLDEQVRRLIASGGGEKLQAPKG
jgi:hypothetical protein